MTLLEALVALVILGVSATGFLGAFQASAQSTRNADAWVTAVSLAEASMEATKFENAQLPGDSLPPGFSRTIRARPWDEAARIDEIMVRIGMPDGGAFELRRLVRR